MSKTPEEALKIIEEEKRDNSTNLDLAGFNLTEFPPEIFELTNLTGLILYDNQLTKLPEAIEKLTNLNR